MAKVKIGTKSDFKEESMCNVIVDGSNILVTNVGGEIFATEANCPHQGFPLAGAKREGFIFICRLHGGQFDVRTGKRIGGYPSRDLRTFPVSYEGDDLFIDI